MYQFIETSPNVYYISCFQKALDKLEGDDTVDKIFVIGGSQIYKQAIEHSQCQFIYFTMVTCSSIIPVDTFFPLISLDVFEHDSTYMIPPMIQQLYQCFYLRYVNKLWKGYEEEQHQKLKQQQEEYEWQQNKQKQELKQQEQLLEWQKLQQQQEQKEWQQQQLILLQKMKQHQEEKEKETIFTNPSSFVPHEEYQYLNHVRNIINQTSPLRYDRTHTGTLSTFGLTMKFNLRNNQFPLLTTRKLFFKGIVEELLWFISGNTNGKTLKEKGVKIWDANGSRSYLDSIGLKDREVDDLGPVYGFQWRHFGAEYKDIHTNYQGQGIDQLANIINTIKTNPNDRRMILTAWNPTDLNKMALPPCHLLCQFYVNNGELSCQLYQRSGDMGLGVPFNIASYSLLTYIMAQVCGLKCGDFIHVLGDAHVYSNHINALKTQIERTPKPFPQIELNPNVKDIDQFNFKDFILKNYECYDNISMKMSV